MKLIRSVLAMVAMLAISSLASANKYTDTVTLFKNAGESAAFFPSAYGYAVFPTIGKGGLIVGGAHGSGHVYEKGKYIGNTSVTQISVGFQAGGEAYSQIVFFEDKRALDEFTNGNFEFEAGVNAVAVTAAASGTAGTQGASAGASGGKKDATTAGSAYYKGMAVFTIAKGGAMFQATVAGQKFTFEAKKDSGE
jgi:lipid-binding SYLF domain-containing protein